MMVMEPILGLITTIQRLEACVGLDVFVITTNVRLEDSTRGGWAALRDSRPAAPRDSLGIGLAPGLA